MTARAGAAICLPLPGWQDPVSVLRAFAGDPMPVLLHSAASGSGRPDHARWSILCAGPFEVVSRPAGIPGDPLRDIVARVGRHHVHAAGDLPFWGGAVGFIGYEAGHPAGRPPDPVGGPVLPAMLFGMYSWAIVWDHRAASWAVVSSGLPGEGPSRRERAAEEAAAIAARIAAGASTRDRPEAPEPPGGSGMAPVLSSTVSRDRYLEMVRTAKDLIGDGEVYQVNLSQRLELPPPRDPVSFFASVCRHSTAPFSAYLDAGAFQVVSASPERFLRLRERVAESRPIKGTAPRGADAAGDAAMIEGLLRSGKDRAENVMIVDLVRNDLGKVCRPGTVKATAVCRPETYASVHHLVSTVRGTLEEGKDAGDLLNALFPGGSMTGAPKSSAMRIISALEPTGRGIYAGALGYLSFCGGLDLSIVIRTAIVAGGRTWLQVGGGVVSDSDPGAEYDESLHKAASVRRALAATAGW